MMNDRVRVRWPIPLFGGAMLSVIIGFCAATLVELHDSWEAPAEWYYALLLRAGMHWDSPATIALLSALLLLFPLLCFIWLPIVVALSIPRVKRRLVLTMAYGLSFVLAWLLVRPIFSPTALLPSVKYVSTYVLLLLAVVLAIAAMFSVAGIMRVLRGKLIEQDGRLCWGCAYPVNESSSPNCPECGRPASSTKRRGIVVRLCSWLDRHNRIGLLLCIILWAATFALAYHEHRPRALFVQTFDVANHPAHAEKHANGLAAYLPGSDDFTIIVAMHQERPLSAPQIHLMSGRFVQSARGDQMVALSVTILRELNDEESRESLRHGVAPDLLDQVKTEGRGFRHPLPLLGPS